jgi:isopenicillin-N epimerase
VDTPAARISYGHSLRPLWELADDALFLNHGSFGACPKIVLAEQDRIRRAMEREPDAFFRNDVMPQEGVETALRRVAARLGAFVGVKGEQLAFIENATVGVQAVLRSIPFARGDRILITNHTYNAVRLMVEARCAETGAEPLVVQVRVPTDDDAFVRAIAEAIVPAVKVAIIDHITSPTALVLPLARILPELRRRNVLSLVDGAHAVGHIPLDLAALEPDWYVSNCHKWLYAPKGSAFLYASDSVARMTRPNVVSHYIAMGFPRAFDFTGTRDNSAWLSVSAALDFHASLDPEGMRAHFSRLLQAATDRLGALGARSVCPPSMCGAMRAYALPQQRAATQEDVSALMRSYWDEERIQLAGYAFEGALLLRISAQAYLEEQDMDRLREALHRRGWPGREEKE